MTRSEGSGKDQNGHLSLTDPWSKPPRTDFCECREHSLCAGTALPHPATRLEVPMKEGTEYVIDEEFKQRYRENKGKEKVPIRALLSRDFAATQVLS